jgi:hypothetical protein
MIIRRPLVLKVHLFLDCLQIALHVSLSVYFYLVLVLVLVLTYRPQKPWYVNPCLGNFSKVFYAPNLPQLRIPC